MPFSHPRFIIYFADDKISEIMKQLLLYCAALCLLTSCSKHNDKPADPNDPDPKPSIHLRIKSINGNTYAYDSLGRLVKSFYSNSLTARTEYTYTKDSLVGSDFDLQGNRVGSAAVYYLGSDGLATSEKYIIDPSIAPIILSFTYNADRRIVDQTVGEKGKTPTNHTLYFYSKGNLDSSKAISIPDNKVLQVERFEYYTDQPNLLNNESNGVAFIGVGSTNLVKKEVRVNDGATTTIEYTYEFDTQKRPVKRHITIDGAPWTDLTYTWF
jgi:hypothetical protein